MKTTIYDLDAALLPLMIQAEGGLGFEKAEGKIT